MVKTIESKRMIRAAIEGDNHKLNTKLFRILEVWAHENKVFRQAFKVAGFFMYLFSLRYLIGAHKSILCKQETPNHNKIQIL
jgi:hypothetical protein